MSIISISTYCQDSSKVYKMINGLEKFSLGDSIVKFKGLLTCADDGKPKEVLSLEGKLTCIGFRFIDSVKVGLVRFSNTFLLVDSLKKINQISYDKIYIREELLNPKSPANQEYRKINTMCTK